MMDYQGSTHPADEKLELLIFRLLIGVVCLAIFALGVGVGRVWG